VEVGPKGLYFLELRPDHKLKSLLVEPDEVVVDLHFGNGRLEKTIGIHTLVYSFYNPSKRENIVITAAIVYDDEDIYSKLKADPENIIWRQYFIKKALHKSETSPVLPPLKIYPEMMTAEQVADYLQMEVATIRNWTSQNKIPFKKIGRSTRYSKSEIDAAVESRKIGKVKKRTK